MSLMYSNPEKVREFIKKIPQHLYKLDYEAVKIDCNDILHSLPIPIIDFENNSNAFNQVGNGGNNLIYRARLEENDKPWASLSEISYIPEDKKEKIMQFGRFNKPFEPMFYGSTSWPTACFESLTKGNIFEERKNVKFTVGIWKIDSPLKFVQMPYSEKYFKLFYDSVDYKSESIQLSHIQKFNKELRQHFYSDIDFEVLQFFADESGKFGIQNDFEYMLTNYYGDRVFNRIKGLEVDEEIDAIWYPSTVSSYQNHNFVFKPESVNSKLKFQSAMQVWVADFSKTGGGAQFIPLKQRIKADESGDFDWNVPFTR